MYKNIITEVLMLMDQNKKSDSFGNLMKYSIFRIHSVIVKRWCLTGSSCSFLSYLCIYMCFFLWLLELNRKNVKKVGSASSEILMRRHAVLFSNETEWDSPHLYSAVSYCCGFMFLQKLTSQFIYLWKKLFFVYYLALMCSCWSFMSDWNSRHLVWLVVKIQK